MEIFEPVRELTNKINSMNSSLDIDKIIIHIERAYQLFVQGIETGEEQNYTDVIYRCNQAFEGCSRQAFLVLADKTEKELRSTQAWEIEKYLIDNEVLNDRLLPLFRNYREKWRNESTHKFNLFFKEEEAYVAILSICSCAYLLLNQIVLKVSLNDVEVRHTKEITKGKESLLEKISKLTKLFLEEVDLEKYKAGSVIPRVSEMQFNGIYASFLQSKLPESKINIEGNLEGGYRYDIMIEYEDEIVVIETKSTRLHSQIKEFAKEQLMHYMNLIEGAKGIVFIFDGIGKMKDLKINDYTIQKGNRKYEIKLLEGVK